MDEPNIKNYLEYDMVAAQFGEDTAPKPPIETAEQAIQEMGDPNAVPFWPNGGMV